MEGAIEPELPLEVQLRLARWKLEIKKLKLEDLQAMYMMLAQESAQKELQYQDILKAALASDRACHIRLSNVEKKYASCEQRLFDSPCANNLE